MSSVVVVTSDPAITVSQDAPAITAIVPVTQFPLNKSGFSLSVELSGTVDFNTVITAGFYNTIDNQSTNVPTSGLNWYLQVDVDGDNPETYIRQTATILDATAATYIRTMINGGWGAWQPLVTLDTLGRLPPVDGSLLTNVNTGLSLKILNAIGGLTLSTAGSTSLFGVAAGATNDSTNAATMVLPSAISKTTNSWSSGNGNGALDAGTIAINTWYHIFLISDSTATVVDVLISLSPAAPTLPSGFTLFRRIGSMKTNSSGNWIQFTQSGDEFLWTTQVQDVAAGNLTSTALLSTLSVPTGVKVWTISNFWFGGTGSGNIFYLVSSPDVSDLVPSSSFFDAASATGVFGSTSLPIRTNTSGQIRVRASSTFNGALYIATKGWTDRRGKI